MTPQPDMGSDGRVWAARIAVASVALGLAALVVIVLGDQVDLRPVDAAPDASATVSTRAVLRIRFANPMHAESVESRFQLEPSVPGRLSWAGSTLVFQPSTPLLPATDYHVRLAPGVAEQRGRSSRTPFTWSFRTRPEQVIVLRRTGSVANLWLIDVASGGDRQLTTESVDVVDYALAPEGDRIAYTRQDAPARTSVWLIELATGRTTRLSPDEAASFAAPAWAPDGRLLAVERRADTIKNKPTPKIALLRADGSSGGLVYGRGDEVGFGPRWSPDGTRLAFFDPVRSAIIVFNFTPDRLSVPIQTAVAFDWSPDGKALAVEDIVVEGSAFQHVVQLADVETGNLRRITERGAIDESAPAWSPEGGRLAFTQRGTVGQIDGAQPMVRDLATMAVAPVLPSGDRTRDRMIETSSIVWSSDGQRLLLGRSTLGDPGAKPEVWLVALGGEARRLGEGDAPRWLP